MAASEVLSAQCTRPLKQIVFKNCFSCSQNECQNYKQTTGPWSTATVERHQFKMAVPAKFKAENGSYSHAILKIIKNILECFFLRIFNLGYITNILKIICFNNRGSL